MTSSKQEKYDFLKTLIDDSSVIEEVLAYTKNKFRFNSTLNKNREIDKQFISTWNAYKAESEKIGVFKMLQSKFKQFQFPIQKNISIEQDYKNATLRGKTTLHNPLATGLSLKKPDELKLIIYHSIAGTIPVLIVANDADFISVIQALSHKNEPVDIPQAMGAAFINGINNWDRINTIKKEWESKNHYESWGMFFKENILPKPELYKDKLIVLSTKPYSAVSAADLGISLETWKKYSLEIRLEHECTHLFTLKNYGEMANNMHDELLADYMGIRKVLGTFNKSWFFHFIGLEDYPDYRLGARFENYLGNPSISNNAFKLLQTIVKKAADNLELFDNQLGIHKSTEDRMCRLNSLCSLDLVELASEKGVEKLLTQYQKSPHNQLLNA